MVTVSEVSFIADTAILSTLVTGILPGLALKIFLMLLPPILAAMMRFSGVQSLSQVDLGVVSRYFLFQVREWVGGIELG